jgi:hypothetical protein
MGTHSLARAAPLPAVVVVPGAPEDEGVVVAPVPVALAWGAGPGAVSFLPLLVALGASAKGLAVPRTVPPAPAGAFRWAARAVPLEWGRAR